MKKREKHENVHKNDDFLT